MYVAFEGDLDRVIRLLDEGSDVNARDSGGDTALMFALMGGHFLIGHCPKEVRAPLCKATTWTLSATLPV